MFRTLIWLKTKNKKICFVKPFFLKIKLMKTMKMCLKCMLLFIISCFRESYEKKIEVEDKRGRK